MNARGEKLDIKGWGGKREGAGRRRLNKELASERTKVIRVDPIDYKLVKNGAYRKIVSILQEKRSAMDKSKQYRDSPRWSKMWCLMDEIEEILGDDWDNWIDE